jgi:F0F1-type ATP synthase membrane subunit b/b'
MGFMDKAKQMAEEATAKAKATAADLQEKAGPAMEKAKQGAADLGEKAKEKLSK